MRSRTVEQVLFVTVRDFSSWVLKASRHIGILVPSMYTKWINGLTFRPLMDCGLLGSVHGIMRILSEAQALLKESSDLEIKPTSHMASCLEGLYHQHHSKP